MSKPITQVGSIHMVVMITLVTIIIGLLGWVLYRNYAAVMTKTSDRSEVSRNESSGLNSPPDDYLRGSTTREFGAYLTFQYPKDWSIEHVSEYYTNERTGKKSPTVQQTIVRSPSKRYEVVYDLLVDDTDSLCFKLPSRTIKKLSYHSLSDWKNVSFVTTAEGNDTDGYMAEFALNELSAALLKDAVNTADTCKLHDGRVIDFDKNKRVSLGEGFIKVAGINETNDQRIIEGASLDEISAAFSGSDYEIAKGILLTTKPQ